MRAIDILKVIGKGTLAGAKMVQPFTAIIPGGLIFSNVIAAIIGAGQAANQLSEDRKSVALAKLIIAHPTADPHKLSAAIDLQLAAMKAMQEAERVQ